MHGELKIWHDPVYEDKINLDCGAAYGWTICKSSTYNSTAFDKFFEILVKIVLTTYNK